MDDNDLPEGPTDHNPDVGEGLLDEDMGPSGALSHLYRGEVHRMMLWRERLDRTTNWAVLVLAALLTWSFSSSSNPHYVLLFGILIISVFLTVEARRYRAYDMWRERVRFLQCNVFANGLAPEKTDINKKWRKQLSNRYATPSPRVSREEAIAHRLRRVYLPIYAVLGFSWLIRVTGFTTASWPESAAVGIVNGPVVTAIVALAYLFLAFVAFRPRSWSTGGELLDNEPLLDRDEP